MLVHSPIDHAMSQHGLLNTWWYHTIRDIETAAVCSESDSATRLAQLMPSSEMMSGTDVSMNPDVL